MMMDVIIEVKKFNKWHDPKTGRFTTAPEGSDGGLSISELVQSGVLDAYNYIGVRTPTPDENYAVGDTARESYDWDFENDQSTYETDGRTLGGTSAVDIVRYRFQDSPEEVEAALLSALDASKNYVGDRKVIIGGERQRYGDDPGETIIENAKVLAVYDPKSGKWKTEPPKEEKKSKKDNEKQITQKPKITREDVENYKNKAVDDFLATYPGKMNRIAAVGNLPFEQKKKINALINYVNLGDEKWLKGIDLGDVIGKSRYDIICEIEKFNPYHGADGRFTTAGGARSFTFKPGASSAHNAAIERERKRYAGDLQQPSGDMDADRKAEWKGASVAVTIMPGWNGTQARAMKLGNDTKDLYDKEKSDAALNNGHVILADSKAYNDAIQTVKNKAQKQGITDTGKMNEMLGKELDARAVRSLSNNYLQDQRAASKKFEFTIPKGGSLPDNLSGVKRIKGDTYANKEKIKAAGFKWDSSTKSWVKKSIDCVIEIG